MTDHPDDMRKLGTNLPDDQRDPSNSDPDNFTAPLAEDDNVYSLVYPDQGDLRETAPAGPDA